MKDTFDGLSKMERVEGRISELEDMSVETENWKAKRTKI